MRNICLLLIFILASLYGYAQKYVPFPTEGVVWKEYAAAFKTEPEFQGWDFTIEFAFVRDTIINNKTYYLLGAKEWKKFWYKDPKPYKVEFADYRPFWAIREDNKHVYIYDTKSQKDTLLYDFNLSLGALPKTLLHKGGNVVSTIDSVLLEGKYYRRYGIRDGYDSSKDPFTYIIEGIGNTAGILKEITRNPGGDSRLICFSQNGQTIYKANDSVNCTLLSAINEPKFAKLLFNIFPNPTSGQFTIQTQSIFSDSYICVRDVLGRVILQEKLQYPNQTINISSQPKGLYFVELRNGNNRSVQKLIFQ